MHASLGTSDPSDVATIAYEQLIHNPQALHDIRSRLHHVILDEYQDVSVSQHRLLRLIINGIDHSVDTKEIEKSIKFPVLMEESKKKIRIDGPVCYHVPKFFAAGDPNQSIYGWRGAAPSLTVDGFKKDYPQGVIVPLPKNYRLSKNILDAANVLIGESGMDMEYNQETIESDYTLKKNDVHIQVEGAVMKESESSVMIHGLWDLREEAKYIAATIRKRAKARINNYAKVYEQVSKQKPSPQNSLFDSSDIAVMFRSSKEINLFKDALSQHGIPYIVPAERKSLNSKSNGNSHYMKNQRMSSISMKPVKLMTMHHAKGDEFDDVYLANWTEGSFPHPTSVLTNRLQEERRIAYVALTRAKQNVIITYSFMTRDTYFGPNGEKKEVTQQVDASRFLHDLMPDSNEDHLDGVEWNESVGFKEVIAGKDLPPHYAKSFKIPTGYRSQESVSTSINENLSQDNANLSTEYVKLPDNDEDLKKDEVFETLHHGMNMIFNRKRGACKQYKPIFRNMLKDQGISRGRIQVLKREYSSKELKCIHALVNAPSDNIATRPISRCTAKQLGLYLFALLSK
jgi:superfamily I DNA/RNA helicase